MKTGSLTEYAAHRGCSNTYVTTLKRQGRLVFADVNGKKLVNFAMSDRLVANTADQSRLNSGKNSPSKRPERAQGAISGGGEGQGTGSGEETPIAAPVSTHDVQFRRAQTLEKITAAKTADLTYKRLVNASLDRELVERTVFDAFRSLRDQAFQAPQRAALRAIGQTDVREIERCMTDELRKSFDTWEARMAARLPPLAA